MVFFYHLGRGAVALPEQDMVEFGNCRKCQKCTDFTQFHPFLALLRTLLRLVLVWGNIWVPGSGARRDFLPTNYH